MGSTRLPGKVLKSVENRPLLQHQIERLKQVTVLGHDIEIVVATTALPDDDAIVSLCRTLAIKWFRGATDDVLDRYFRCAQENNADVIVRVTSDCPLIDPKIIERVIQFFLDEQPVDYASNTIDRTFPRGMDTEVFSFDALAKAHTLAIEKPDREHVTRYLYTHPSLFKCASYKSVTDLSRHRWTVDTAEDFDLVSRLLVQSDQAGGLYSMEEIVRVLEKNPDWELINAHIQQKTV